MPEGHLPKRGFVARPSGTKSKKRRTKSLLTNNILIVYIIEPSIAKIMEQDKTNWRNFAKTSNCKEERTTKYILMFIFIRINKFEESICLDYKKGNDPVQSA